MNTMNLITDKQHFVQTAESFFNIMFAKALKNGCGQIEIRGFKNGPKHQSYHNSIDGAVNTAYALCLDGLDVYFGVNPRVGQAGAKENVHWMIAFHAEVDYGQEGHKKKPEYDTREEAFEAITKFEFKPTIVNHSGGGFHCYWILNQSLNVSTIGVNTIENINKSFLSILKGDQV